jgi:hypothetical protein
MWFPPDFNTRLLDFQKNEVRISGNSCGDGPITEIPKVPEVSSISDLNWDWDGRLTAG